MFGSTSRGTQAATTRSQDAEEARNFSATRRFSVSPEGVEQWEWITDYPYLVVTAPSLRLLTQKEPWHARTIIVLRHAVAAKPTPPAGK